MPPKKKKTIVFTHKVKLHFRNLTGKILPGKFILKSIQKVYHPHGIKIELVSSKDISLSKKVMKKYKVVDGACKWDMNDPNVNEMGLIHKMEKRSSFRSGFFDWVPISIPFLKDLEKLPEPDEIVVFFIGKFNSSLLGCGGHLPNAPGAIVDFKYSYRWDTAHEIGHVLLSSSYSPVHHTKKENLMYQYSNSSKKVPKLGNKQLKQMKKSVACIKI